MENKWEQIKIEVQDRIKKVIADRKLWSVMLGDDSNNSKGIIKPYGMITDMDCYAWAGGYPMFYVTKDAGAVCPKCVNESLELLSDEFDPQWYVVGWDINYEDDCLYCDHCGKKIESAYGEDEE